MRKIKAETPRISKLIAQLKAQFQKAGLEDPRLEAELIISHALGVSRPEIYLLPDQCLKKEILKKISIWAKQRTQRKPLAYIIGRTWFREIELEINPSVMAPRPETELLVEEAIKLIQSHPEIKKVLDLGTGSGAIILSLAFELKEKKPNLEFFASDISRSALALAQKNARRLGFEKQIIFRLGDLFRAFSGEKFHLIISNPPYVSEPEWQTLMPEVKNYEPQIAICAGKKGTELIYKILEQVPEYLYPGGWLLLEIGLGQAEQLKKIHTKGITLKAIRKDYQGIKRMVIYQKV